MPAPTDHATLVQRGPLPPYLLLDDAAQDLVRIETPTGDRLWLVTGLRLGRQVLTRPVFSRAKAVVPGVPAISAISPDPAALTSLDAPQHTRLRRLVNHVFAPGSVAALEQEIRRTARDQLAGRRRMDLVHEYVLPVAATTICRVLGVPPAERSSFAELADRAHGITPCTAAESLAAHSALRAYFTTLAQRFRQNPDGHPLGALLTVKESSPVLDERGLASLIELLLNAGFETTIGQTSLAVLALLEHPEEWRTLVSCPEAIPGAVEELLRYAPTVPISFTRVAEKDTVLAGTRICSKETVMVSLLHTNFDPRHIEGDPAALKVSRPRAHHLTFGHGPHVCLGAQLARLQMRVMIEELTTAAPDLFLEAGPDRLSWRPTENIVRGPTALPVSW